MVKNKNSANITKVVEVDKNN